MPTRKDRLVQSSITVIEALERFVERMPEASTRRNVTVGMVAALIAGVRFLT